MALGFIHPVIGQEAICPDGLGRVSAFKDEFPDQWIQVRTYIEDRGCRWAIHNVELVIIGPTKRVEKLSKYVKRDNIYG